MVPAVSPDTVVALPGALPRAAAPDRDDAGLRPG